MNVLYPIYLSLAFLGVSIVIAWSMAESLQACHRALNINWRKANPFFVLREAMRFRRFQLFSGPFFLNQLTECVYQFVVLYTKRRFGWGYMTLGFYVSIIGICLAIVQGSLRYFVPRFVSENGCVTVGLFGHALAMGVISVATHGWMMGLTILPQVGPESLFSAPPAPPFSLLQIFTMNLLCFLASLCPAYLCGCIQEVPMKKKNCAPHRVWG